MENIKNIILSYLNNREGQSVAVPSLDRYLVYVKKEEKYIGGELLNVLQTMLTEGTISRGEGSIIHLTEKGEAKALSLKIAN